MAGQHTLTRHPRISMDPAVCHGHPVVTGTRLLVSQILGALASGDSRERVLEDYPSLQSEDIDAALAFASELSRFEEVPSPDLTAS